MTNSQQVECARKLFDECLEILESKGKAYSGDDDAHANFKQTASKIGNTEYQVWATYFGKHVDCIMRAIWANPSAPVDDTEGLRGRILDAVNYLAILCGMICGGGKKKGDKVLCETCEGCKYDRKLDNFIPCSNGSKYLGKTCTTCKYRYNDTDEFPCHNCHIYIALPNWRHA